MKPLSLIALLAPIIAACPAIAQYSYFNQVIGLGQNNGLETAVNVEVLGDSIYTWGTGLEDGVIFAGLRIFDNDGVVIDSNKVYFPDAYVYGGRTASFQRIPSTTDFLFSQGQWANDTLSGSLMRFNSNLDSIWSKSYDLYSPHTYFFTHTVNEEGFLVAGEQAVLDVGRGTFILQADFDGNTLWHSEVHAPEDGVFRNRKVSSFDNRIILSGGSGLGPTTVGRIEVLDQSGLLLHEIVSPGLMTNGVMQHHITSDSQVIGFQPLGIEDYSGSTDPSITINLLRFYTVDVEGGALSYIGDFLEEEQWIDGYPVKMIEVEDGYVLAGGYYKETISSIHLNGWIMKINDNYEQEWYTELSYDGEETSTHFLWDVEQTSDGGYVTVGEYYNDDDPFRRTWLVKLDACGDLEWQGCEPVGVGEFEIQDIKLEIWPNPVTDRLHITFPESSGSGGGLKVIDITGRVVKEMSNSQDSMSSTSTAHSTGDEVEIDIAQLNTGMYSIILSTKDGKQFSGKFIKE